MTEDHIEKEMQDAECQIIKVLISCTPLIIIGVLAPIAAYNSIFIPENESKTIWFQRSGSLSVLFGVLAEYNLSKVNEYINLSGIVISSQTKLSEKYKFKYKLIQYAGVLLAIVGTIIWGYGDLFIQTS